MHQRGSRGSNPTRRAAALGLAAVVAMTGLGSIALATAGVAPAAAATSDPTPITPKKVSPEVPVEDGDTLGAITDVAQDLSLIHI